MDDARTWTMSARELDRLEVLGRVIERRLRQRQAAERLGLSLRQVERLCRALRRDGAAGLVSGKRGRPSNRKLPDGGREHALDLVRARYADFGPTLACEKLVEQHDLTVSRETLRGWMIEAGLWVPRSQRPRRATSLATAARASASSSRSTAAITPGSRIGVRAARCSSTSTTPRAG